MLRTLVPAGGDVKMRLLATASKLGYSQLRVTEAFRGDVGGGMGVRVHACAVVPRHPHLSAAFVGVGGWSCDTFGGSVGCLCGGTALHLIFTLLQR